MGQHCSHRITHRKNEWTFRSKAAANSLMIKGFYMRFGCFGLIWGLFIKPYLSFELMASSF